MFGVIALVVAGLSLVLDVVAIAIPYWGHASVEGETLHAGLWTYCSSFAGTSSCESITDPLSSLKATCAVEVLGLLFIAAAIVCYVLKLFVMKQQNKLPKIGAALAFLGGTFAIIGVAIYATKVNEDAAIPGLKPHAAFGLCIVAALGSYVSALLSYLDGRE